MNRAGVGEYLHDGHRLVYSDFGDSDRALLTMHGLLLPRSMHRPLAEALAARGNRVITLDLLGHGESERPPDMWRYSMSLFAEQAIGLLEHLGIDDVVVGGTSLGANVALEVAVRDPGRLRGLVLEMPVLDNALLGCALAFAPLLLAYTFGAPLSRLVGALGRRLPRGLGRLPDLGLDAISQEPHAASAVLQGLFFGRVAPPRAERRTIEQRALVIGHSRDPVHPFSDADMLVRELRRGRLVQASSIAELYVTPQRLTDEIARFLDECWRPIEARGGGRARVSA